MSSRISKFEKKYLVHIELRKESFGVEDRNEKQ